MALTIPKARIAGWSLSWTTVLFWSQRPTEC